MPIKLSTLPVVPEEFSSCPVCGCKEITATFVTLNHVDLACDSCKLRLDSTDWALRLAQNRKKALETQ